MNEPSCDLPGLALMLFRFERVDEFDGGEESDALSMMLNGLDANGCRQMRFPRARRSSDILPGIRATGGFIIRFTRDVGRRQLLFGVSVSKAETCSSFISSMGRWRIFHAG